MNRRIQIAPSIFAADFYNLSKAVDLFETCGVDLIHYDVMDNHFVPNLSIGPKLIEDIASRTPIPANVHLMIDLQGPETLKPYLSLPVENITIHLEAPVSSLDPYLEQIQSAGKKAGISIKPKTPVSTLSIYLDRIALALIMSVEPGFSGQKWMPESLEKVKELNSMKGTRDIVIQIDGGVDRSNYEQIIQAGANCLVIGSAFFKDHDPIQWVKNIHSIA